MNRDLALGGAGLALAAGYSLMAATIPASLLSDAVGPRALPNTYAVVLSVLSLLLIIRSIPSVRRPRTNVRGVGHQPDHDDVRSVRLQPDRGTPIDRPALWRVAGLLAIGATYVAVVPWIGYLPSLAGLIAATIYYQGGVLNRHVVVVALSGAAVFWLLFVMLLGIPQPAGLWPAFF